MSKIRATWLIEVDETAEFVKSSAVSRAFFFFSLGGSIVKFRVN